LVAEIQRSLGFFTSNNRNATLGDMVALGNPMKLPGLQRFLSQNLDQEVKLIDNFKNLVGGTATAGPQFKENQLTFGVAYGLCVQALDAGQLRTNLLPDEIVTTRLVRAKKPWAVAAAALLLGAFTVNYFGHYSSVTTADTTGDMGQELAQAKKTADSAKSFTDSHTELNTKFDSIATIGNNLQSNVDGRLLWLEVLKAVDAALPKDTRAPEQRKETEEDIAKRTELHFDSMDEEYFADITPWKTSVAAFITKAPAPAAPAAGAPATDAAGTTTPTAPAGTPTAPPVAATAPTAGTPPAADATGGAPADTAAASTGGWVIEMRGYHLHNNLPDKNIDVGDEGEQFLRNTFIKNLENGKVTLPDGPNGEPIEVPISELGVSMPVVVTNQKTQTVTYMAEPSESSNGSSPTPVGPEALQNSGATSDQQPKMFKLRQYDFIVQFCWQPKPRTSRLKEMAEKKAAPAGETPAATAPGGTAAADGDAAHNGPSS
jgi:type IV pilus assembly protein PilM